MGSKANQATYLNFYSELPTDQVIFTKSDTVPWTAAQNFIYNTGLGDICLPIAQYSIDGEEWFNQGNTAQSYFFANPTCSDDGVITVAQSAPAAPKTLRIRLMGLAHPNQKPFQRAETGSDLSYLSNFNYRKVAASGVLQVPIVANAEQSLIVDIPHDVKRIANYTIFARFLSGNKFITTLLAPNSRPKIAIDKEKLHFDNYMTNPFVQLQARQYFYFIYYD